MAMPLDFDPASYSISARPSTDVDPYLVALGVQPSCSLRYAFFCMILRVKRCGFWHSLPGKFRPN
ncbi:hypothetical protein SBA5_380042 [Candidatus Sulfotelmatomonas gaucii]|uniref:Uncharacterized protein n=1 Tax=Candidatus Sulfuritelmatomonas gaucii TaxID=2043161 RepID=A0A2N9LJ67_9BACT|nr:hypothetical protein SBA5_380042 [Candidatus Sulfotelmatomonas gaucii]